MVQLNLKNLLQILVKKECHQPLLEDHSCKMLFN